MVCHPGQGTDVGAHVLTRPADAPAHGSSLGTLPGCRNAGAITEEHHVKAATLGGAGKLLEHAQIGEASVHPRPGHAPAAIKVGVGHVTGKMHQGFHCKSVLVLLMCCTDLLANHALGGWREKFTTVDIAY